ncbi:MAG: hypothetical protein J6S67_10650 [Methanobrevibacter sp.]|nr:hypothetical protein [Methanobrevibacter sp.]
MTEREIADIRIENNKQKKEIKFLKWLLKQREIEIMQLKLLLHQKIRKKVSNEK